MSFSTKLAPLFQCIALVLALVHCLISYDINVLGMITRTALYYSIFVDELGLIPPDISYQKKKQLSDIFLCENAERKFKALHSAFESNDEMTELNMKSRRKGEGVI